MKRILVISAVTISLFTLASCADYSVRGSTSRWKTYELSVTASADSSQCDSLTRGVKGVYVVNRVTFSGLPMTGGNPVFYQPFHSFCVAARKREEELQEYNFRVQAGTFPPVSAK